MFFASPVKLEKIILRTFVFSTTICKYVLIDIPFVDELDSFMYQTVGHMGIEILAKAMCLPLYRQETKGKSTQTGKHYVPTDNDEVEDLYNLLDLCKVRK